MKSLASLKKYQSILETEGKFTRIFNFVTQILNNLLHNYRDNYGFVTFRNKKDAFSAIERGNDDTSQPRVDLCFGGRRAFCKEKYADLGKISTKFFNNLRFFTVIYLNRFWNVWV